MKKAYTNKELAENYFRIMYGGKDYTPHSKKAVNYRNIQRRIEESSTDINSFYRENGNLQGLVVFGMASRTKRILELILGNGPDKAREFVEKMRKDPEFSDYVRDRMKAPKGPISK